MPNLPTIAKVLQRGEINDELDYALMNYLIQNRIGDCWNNLCGL